MRCHYFFHLGEFANQGHSSEEWRESYVEKYAICLLYALWVSIRYAFLFVPQIANTGVTENIIRYFAQAVVEY
jgi:hypothetical protein